jgi:hypothetical protein
MCRMLRVVSLAGCSLFGHWFEGGRGGALVLIDVKQLRLCQAESSSSTLHVVLTDGLSVIALTPEG